MAPAGRRAAGQIRARNLAEIVGNEYIFTELHAHFVALLQQLGLMFGGIPLNEERFVCSTVGDDEIPSASQPVLVSKAIQPQNGQKYDTNDIDMSTLEISAGPKAIPIAPRRPVMA
ncbi:Folliculin [Penicillium roqueforti FM164]|uniref:Folliculin n=1 Tax=Penicillium roqueforti (strain FM164) TaxID=1365484 RepID=W6QD96_PENRF|nr:Folliculin [Penicillium roqueforti FM164]